MKENVLDVLVYLFDNYMSAELELYTDEMTLACELEQAGFPAGEIYKAFDWLSALADFHQEKTLVVGLEGHGMRIFTETEQQKLSAEARGFIWHLEEIGVLDPVTREMIIESALALDVEEVNLREFKRIIGLILMNSPKHEEILAMVEDILYDEIGELVH